MKFTSKNPSIASVTEQGTVVGVASGSTVIEVKEDNGAYRGQIPTNVVANDSSYIPVTGVSLNYSSVSLKYAYEFSKQLRATVTPANATNKAITWTSSDPSSLSAKNGYLKCLRDGVGTYTVTASSVDGPAATCTVSIVRNGTVVNSVSPSTINMSSADSTTYHISVDTTDYDGYKSGFSVFDTYGLTKAINKTDNGFDLVVSENVGSDRQINVYVQGLNSGDDASVITINQPYSRIASAFISPSDGGTSYCHADGSFYHKDFPTRVTGLDTIYFQCAQEAFNDIINKLGTSESWLTIRSYHQYREDIGGMVGIAAAPNTTGSPRTAYVTFPGGLMYYVEQDA